jgi:hypothetical protein
MKHHYGPINVVCELLLSIGIRTFPRPRIHPGLLKMTVYGKAPQLNPIWIKANHRSDLTSPIAILGKAQKTTAGSSAKRRHPGLPGSLHGPAFGAA